MAKTTIPAGYIAANAITSTELAANSVTAAAIASGALVVADIADNAITGAKIAANAVGSSELASGALSGQNFTGDVTFDTDVLFVDSVNNNVGIGTSSPVSVSGYTITTLNNSANGSALYLQQGAATKGRVITTANELTVDTTAAIPLVFGTNNTERMRIDSSGNVKVNDGYLEVNTESTAAAVVRVDYNATDSIRRIHALETGGGNARTLQIHAQEVRFRDDTTERMRIDSSGNVGIGNDNPDYKLDFAVDSTIRLRHTAAGSAIRVGASDYDVNLIRFDGSSGQTDNSYYGGALRYMGSRSSNANSLSIFMDNSVGTEVEAMTIQQNGTVGIGTDSPNTRLHVLTGGTSGYTAGANRGITITDSIGPRLILEDTGATSGFRNLFIKNEADLATIGFLSDSGNAFSKDQIISVHGSGSVGINCSAGAGKSFEVQDKQSGYSSFWVDDNNRLHGRGVTNAMGLLGGTSTQYDGDGASYPIYGFGGAADNAATENVTFWVKASTGEWQPMVFFCIGASCTDTLSTHTAGWALIRATYYNGSINASVLDSGGGGSFTISAGGSMDAYDIMTVTLGYSLSGATRTTLSVWGNTYQHFRGAQRA